MHPGPTRAPLRVRHVVYRRLPIHEQALLPTRRTLQQGARGVLSSLSLTSFRVNVYREQRDVVVEGLFEQVLSGLPRSVEEHPLDSARFHRNRDLRRKAQGVGDRVRRAQAVRVAHRVELDRDRNSLLDQLRQRKWLERGGDGQADRLAERAGIEMPSSGSRRCLRLGSVISSFIHSRPDTLRRGSASVFSMPTRSSTLWPSISSTSSLGRHFSNLSSRAISGAIGGYGQDVEPSADSRRTSRSRVAKSAVRPRSTHVSEGQARSRPPEAARERSSRDGRRTSTIAAEFPRPARRRYSRRRARKTGRAPPRELFALGRRSPPSGLPPSTRAGRLGIVRNEGRPPSPATASVLSRPSPPARHRPRGGSSRRASPASCVRRG